jgi:NAD+ synthase
MPFDTRVLELDCASVTEKMCSFIREQMLWMRRDGAVVGMSGGIDSALCAELCTRALGKEKVVGIILPEKESDPRSAQYAAAEANKLGIRTLTIDVTPILESLGAYQKRDRFIRTLFPEYDERCKSKIVLPSKLLDTDSLTFFRLIVECGGQSRSARLDNAGLRQIVSATNMKQRTRMTSLYYQAELWNYLVCGTTNKSETVQGFFVKYGDGGVDIEPIADLYKVQVYQMARHLGVIDDIIRRDPSPDTFSMSQSDEEFYFRIPFDRLDLLLYAWEKQSDVKQVCEALSLTEEQVRRAFRDFSSKSNTTKHLRMLPPSLIL